MPQRLRGLWVSRSSLDVIAQDRVRVEADSKDVGQRQQAFFDPAAPMFERLPGYTIFVAQPRATPEQGSEYLFDKAASDPDTHNFYGE